jgi:hypothetical protein
MATEVRKNDAAAITSVKALIAHFSDFPPDHVDDEGAIMAFGAGIHTMRRDLHCQLERQNKAVRRLMKTSLRDTHGKSNALENANKKRTTGVCQQHQVVIYKVTGGLFRLLVLLESISLTGSNGFDSNSSR